MVICVVLMINGEYFGSKQNAVLTCFQNHNFSLSLTKSILLPKPKSGDRAALGHVQSNHPIIDSGKCISNAIPILVG